MFFDPGEVGMKPPPFKHTVYNSLVVPRPIGWITTVSPDGVINLAPFSFFNSLSPEGLLLLRVVGCLPWQTSDEPQGRKPRAG